MYIEKSFQCYYFPPIAVIANSNAKNVPAFIGIDLNKHGENPLYKPLKPFSLTYSFKA